MHNFISYLNIFNFLFLFLVLEQRKASNENNKTENIYLLLRYNVMRHNPRIFRIEDFDQYMDCIVIGTMGLDYTIRRLAIWEEKNP